MPASRCTTASRHVLCRPQPVGRRADEIVSKPTCVRRTRRKPISQAPLDPALSRHVRTAIWTRARCARTSTVSVRRPGEAFGTRREIKNVNSIRFVGQSIEYEARPPDRHPRGRRRDRPGDPSLRCQQGRDPLDAFERRGARLPLLPDPDLLPLEFDDAFVEVLKADLPELPDDKKERFVRDLGLSVYDASVLVSEKAIADYFEAVAKGRDARRRELGDQRSSRRAEQGPERPSRKRRSRRRSSRYHRSHQGRHHFRQARKGSLRISGAREAIRPRSSRAAV